MKLLIEEYGKLIIIIIVMAALIGLVAIFKLKGYSLADTSLGAFVGVSQNAIQDTDTSRTTYSAKIPSSTSSTISSSGGNFAKVKAGETITIDPGYINSAKTITVASLAEQTPGTATAGDILAGKTVWVNGVEITGILSNNGSLTNDTVALGTIPAGYYSGDSLTRKGAQTYTPGTSNQTIAAGQFLTGIQTIKGDANLQASNIAKGITIFGVTGTYSSDATASASDILQGKTVYINGEKVTGTLNPTTFTSGATATADKILAGYTAYVNGTKITGTIQNTGSITVTPSTSNQKLAKGRYIDQDITIRGDANLIAENIKTGVSIFSVNGTFTSDGTATADKILEGYTAYVKGQKVTGTASLSKLTQDGTATAKDILAGKTAYVNGQKLTGSLVVKDLTTDATATAADIRSGKTAYTSNGKVTGTLTTVSETPGTAAAIDIMLGKTAWVNGVKLTGTMTPKTSFTYYQVTGADNEGLTYRSTYALGNGTVVKLGIGDAAQFQAGYYSNGFKVENTVINRGDKSANLNCGQSVTLAAGYYTGGTIKANSLASQTSANAGAAQLLTGYTAWVNGVKISGSMPNQGVKTSTLNAGQSYTIPAGYHNGSGKITANSLASQTSANAGAAQLLTGYTAWVNGVKISGSMPNQGAKTSSLNAGQSYTIPAGYHNGSGKITANSLASQTSANASAAQLLTGYTAWVNGVKVTGTMPDNSTKTSNGNVPGINSSYPNIPTREGGNLQYCYDTNGTARINLGVPAGYYPGVGGSYVNRPASEFGNASAAQVLSGYTFTSKDGLSISGNVPIRSSSSQVAGNKAWHYNNRIYFGIDYGYYPAASYGGLSNVSEKYITYSALASVIGLDASKMLSGYSVLGVNGTLESPSSAYNRGVTDADNRANGSSVNYQSGYNAGYSKGVSDADGRANSSSVNYQSGYNAGVAAGQSQMKTQVVNAMPVDLWCVGSEAAYAIITPLSGYVTITEVSGNDVTGQIRLNGATEDYTVWNGKSGSTGTVYFSANQYLEFVLFNSGGSAVMRYSWHFDT